MHSSVRLRRNLVTLGISALVVAAAALFVHKPVSSEPAFANMAGRTIVVDAGHGGFDGGAVGASGVMEAKLNLEVALKLRDVLTQSGAKVIMTREGEEGLAGNKREDMNARKGIIEQSGVELVISVHMNKFSDKRVNGPQVFHMPGSEEGEKLAKLMLGELNLATGKNKREIHSENFFMLRNTQAPSVIVECGFISNPDEEALLKDAEYQGRIAKAIAKAVDAYYSS